MKKILTVFYVIEAMNLIKKYKNQREMFVRLIHADSGKFRILEKKPDEEISIMS